MHPAQNNYRKLKIKIAICCKNKILKTFLFSKTTLTVKYKEKYLIKYYKKKKRQTRIKIKKSKKSKYKNILIIMIKIKIKLN